MYIIAIMNDRSPRQRKCHQSLAEQLKKMSSDNRDVKVRKPIKRTEMRIRGLDDSVTLSKVAAAVAQQRTLEQERSSGDRLEAWD